MTIDESAMLGRLVAQAQGAGADLATLRAGVEEATGRRVPISASCGSFCRRGAMPSARPAMRC